MSILLLSACKRSDDRPPAAIVGPGGGTIASADGDLTIAIPEGALLERYEISIGVSAARPESAVGDVYELSPPGLVFRLPVRVSIRAGGAEGAAVSYFAEGLPIPLASVLRGGALEAEIHHFTLVGLSRPVPFADRSAIADRIVAAYVPLLPTPAVIITGPEAALTRGDVVSEPSGHRGRLSAELEADLSPELTRLSADPARFPIEGERFFFWVDLYPNAAFVHDGFYLFVDPATGSFEEHHALWPPLIDGEPFLEDAAARLQSPLTIHDAADFASQNLDELLRLPAPAPASESSSALIGTSRRALAACSGERALLFLGSPEDFLRESLIQVEGYVSSSIGAGFSPPSITSHRAILRAHVLDPIAALERPTGPCWCELFVYFATHGDDYSMVFRDESNSVKGAEELGYDDLLRGLSRVCSVKTTVVVEACGSGSFHDVIRDLRAKTVTRPGLASAYPHILCADNFTLVTGAARGRFGYKGVASFTDILFGRTQPMIFTRRFVEAMETLAGEDRPRDFSAGGDAVVDLSQGLSAVPGAGGFFLSLGEPESKTYFRDPMATNCPCNCCNPTVVITAPPNGASFASDEPIAFAGRATDTDGSDLSGSIAWSSSRDGAFGTGPTVEGMLTEGMHTVRAFVESPSGAPGSAEVTIDVLPPGANRPPVVTILRPANSTTVAAGAQVTFDGSAIDVEDGDLSAALLWRSSLDGALGSGASITATLSAGAHTVAASATDSSGATAEARIDIDARSMAQRCEDLTGRYDLQTTEVISDPSGLRATVGEPIDDPMHHDLTLSGSFGAMADPPFIPVSGTFNLRMERGTTFCTFMGTGIGTFGSTADVTADFGGAVHFDGFIFGFYELTSPTGSQLMLLSFEGSRVGP